MLSAHNDVARAGVMTMATELATPELEFDSDPLECAIITFELRVTIRKAVLDTFNDEVEFLRQHSKEQYNSQLIYGSMAKATEIYGRAVPTPLLRPRKQDGCR